MAVEKKRLQWLDVAKGYGILLVIVGHFSAPVLQVPLYSFHMPLFFFLSGYVFSVKSGLREFVRGKIMRIVLPYFCLGVPLVLSHVLFSKDLTFCASDIGHEMVKLLLGHYSKIFFAWHQFMVIPMLKWFSIKARLFSSEEEMTGFWVQLAFYLLTLIVLTLMNEVLIRTRFRFLVDSGWKKARLPV